LVGLLRTKVATGLPLITIFILSILGMTFVRSQSSCYFTSMRVNPTEGSSVPAGQSITFTITLTGSCPSPGTYSVRAYVVDTATSQIISTNQASLLSSGGFFMVTVNDLAMVPAEPGNWKVQINVYLLLDGSNVGPPSQLTVGLTIVPYTTPITIQTDSIIHSVTSAFAQSTMNARTIQQTTSTIQKQTIGAVTPQANSSTFPVESMSAFVALAVLLLGSGTYVAMRRRRRVADSTKETAETKCVKCGEALPVGTRFCDNCGTRQPSTKQK